MSEHRSSLTWRRHREEFAYPTYTRDHEWRFAGGQTVNASAAPEYLGSPKRVNPEEAFVAAISACHMLTFLAIAARRRFAVESYADDAVGYLEPNGDGKLAITRAELRPRIEFGDDGRPEPGQIESMHEQAHRECFIANSVKTIVTVLPPIDPS